MRLDPQDPHVILDPVPTAPAGGAPRPLMIWTYRVFAILSGLPGVQAGITSRAVTPDTLLAAPAQACIRHASARLPDNQGLWPFRHLALVHHQT